MVRFTQYSSTVHYTLNIFDYLKCNNLLRKTYQCERSLRYYYHRASMRSYKEEGKQLERADFVTSLGRPVTAIIFKRIIHTSHAGKVLCGFRNGPRRLNRNRYFLFPLNPQLTAYLVNVPYCNSRTIKQQLLILSKLLI